MDGDVITFIHTEVPPELGGGHRLDIGARARSTRCARTGWKVIAECPFVKAYIEQASRIHGSPEGVSHSPICVGGLTGLNVDENLNREIQVMAAVRDNKAQSRFELDVEGGVAFANYRLTPSAVIITHTETPRALRGRGIASELVEGALELIRADGRKVDRRLRLRGGLPAQAPGIRGSAG